MEAPRPKKLLEEESEVDPQAQSSAKSIKIGPKLDPTVVYSDRELEELDPTEEEAEKHEAAVLKALYDGTPLSYTESAKDQLAELSNLMEKDYGISPRYAYATQELSQFDADTKKKYRLLRENLLRADLASSEDRTPAAEIEHFTQLAKDFSAQTGFDPFVRYGKSEKAKMPPDVAKTWGEIRLMLNELGVLDENLATPEGRTEYIPPKQPVPQAPKQSIVPPSAAEALSSKAPASTSSPMAQKMNVEAISPGGVKIKPLIITRRAGTFTGAITGGTNPKLGDTQAVVANYKDLSFCVQATEDAIQRAEMAMKILDKPHADAIAALLMKASTKKSGAKHPGGRDISFKKATSIALKAERWVYQAQAAAAKQMVTQSKRCLHEMAGRRKKSTATKNRIWALRHGGGVRPKGNSALAEYRAKKRAAYLEASAREHADTMKEQESERKARKDAKIARLAAAVQAQQG